MYLVVKLKYSLYLAINSAMQKLTRAEEAVMQYLWRLKQATVSEMIESMPDPKPAHSTISTIVRILEDKGFADHKAYGRTHVYFPVVSKRAYSKFNIGEMLSKYFSGSANQLVSFLVEEGDLSISYLDALQRIM